MAVLKGAGRTQRRQGAPPLPVPRAEPQRLQLRFPGSPLGGPCGASQDQAPAFRACPEGSCGGSVHARRGRAPGWARCSSVGPRSRVEGAVSLAEDPKQGAVLCVRGFEGLSHLLRTDAGT